MESESWSHILCGWVYACPPLQKLLCMVAFRWRRRPSVFQRSKPWNLSVGGKHVRGWGGGGHITSMCFAVPCGLTSSLGRLRLGLHGDVRVSTVTGTILMTLGATRLVGGAW